MQMMGVARFDQRAVFYQYLPWRCLSVALHLFLLYWMLAMPYLLTQPDLLCRRAEISQLSHDISGWNATELLWNTGAGSNRATDGMWCSGTENRCEKIHLESLTKHSTEISKLKYGWWGHIPTKGMGIKLNKASTCHHLEWNNLVKLMWKKVNPIP